MTRGRPPAPVGGPLAAFGAAALLEAAARLTEGCLMLTDPLGRIVWCDEAVTRALGLPAASLIGRRFEDIAHPVPIDRGQPRIAVVGRLQTWVYVADLGVEGDPVLEIAAVPLFERGAAQPSAMLLRAVALRDPAGKRAALGRALDAVHGDVCPVAVAGPDDRIRYANLRWGDLFGTGPGDPIGDPATRPDPDAPASLSVPAPAGRPLAAGERLVIAMDEVAASTIGIAPDRRDEGLRREGERHRQLWADLLAAGMTFGDGADDSPPGAGREAERAVGTEPSNVLSRMTPRQREVVAILAEGATNKEIAQRLRISVSTVKIHLRAIADHLGTTNRIRAAGLAARIMETGGR